MKKKINSIIVAAYAVVIIAFICIMAPLLVYRENYIFTIHDYLDSWPPLFEMLRRSDLFFKPDSPMPIAGGQSTCYLYFDFGIYRFLNYIFGIVFGEIINRFLGIIIGFFSIKYLLNKVYTKEKGIDDRTKAIIVLLSGAYACTAVYPNWTISFGVLPLYIVLLYSDLVERRISIEHIIISLLFGFMVYFPCIGIFLLGVFLLSFVLSCICTRRINRAVLLDTLCMIAGVCITNINILIYSIRGDKINRVLLENKPRKGILEAHSSIICGFKDVFMHGQYHAAPYLKVIIPLCLGCFLLQLLQKNWHMFWSMAVFFMIVLFCIIYLLDADPFYSIRYLFGKFLPILNGFNFGRIVYLNNVLWYVLFVIIYSALKKNRIVDGVVIGLLTINVFLVVFSKGMYRDTVVNLRHEEAIKAGEITYSQFYDTAYFSDLKKDIGYSGEGTISVGYHPAVAMYNGFNTMDAYLCINALDYHDTFRKIISPGLEKYPQLAEYYDTWGGRMYVYIDDTRNVNPSIVDNNEEKELLIDTNAFSNSGGKYILSKYKIKNAEDLGMELVIHKDEGSKLYQTWVYVVKEESD